MPPESHRVTLNVTASGEVCVDSSQYESSGVRSFVCSNNIVGQIVRFTWTGKSKIRICEVEIYAGEYVYIIYYDLDVHIVYIKCSAFLCSSQWTKHNNGACIGLLVNNSDKYRTFSDGFPKNLALGAKIMYGVPKLGDTTEICRQPLNKVNPATKIVDGIIMISNTDRNKEDYFDVLPIVVSAHSICMWTICLSKPLRIGYVLIYHSASKCGTDIHI